MSKQETSNHRIGDLILYSIDNTPPSEAIIIDTTIHCVRIKTTQLSPFWIINSSIIDNLGQAPELKLRIYKLEHLMSKAPTKGPPCHPLAIPSPKPYRTGTYILEGAEGPTLIDVDKIDNTYYFRQSGESETYQMIDTIWKALYEFSDPDKGNYLLEPGIYLHPGHKESIEIVPYNGLSYFRFLNESKLLRLHKDDAKELKRFESDSLEINAIMIIDKSETI